MTAKDEYQTNEYIFLNPCRECIVKPCCSQKCKNREDYEHWLPIMDQMTQRFAKLVLKEYEKNSIFRLLK